MGRDAVLGCWLKMGGGFLVNSVADVRYAKKNTRRYELSVMLESRSRSVEMSMLEMYVSVMMCVTMTMK